MAVHTSPLFEVALACASVPFAVACRRLRVFPTCLPSACRTEGMRASSPFHVGSGPVLCLRLVSGGLDGVAIQKTMAFSPKRTLSPFVLQWWVIAMVHCMVVRNAAHGLGRSCLSC